MRRDNIFFICFFSVKWHSVEIRGAILILEDEGANAMLERFAIWMKQKRCKHKYRKRYSKETGGYVMRCTKCEKEMQRYERT